MSSCSHQHQAIVFDEFIDSGMEEVISPFLTPNSRKWAKDLALRSSILAAVILVVAWILSFNPDYSSLSHLALLFVYFLAGTPALIDTVNDLLDLDINIEILMTLAAFSSVLLGSGIEGALLLVLFNISGAMERAVSSKATGSLQELHKIAPTKALVIQNDQNPQERSVKDISVGQKIFVRAGEIIPLDGIIIEGTSFVNLAHLTGEAVPIKKTIGDAVPAGGHTVDGSLTITVTHTSSDSTLTRIIKLVTEAQTARPQLQRWFDRFSQPYATAIIFLAFAISLLLPLIFGMPYSGHEGSIYRALTFLIAASPCALIIATPIAYLSAISSCAKQGILLKGGVMLDALQGCQIIAFDKTGTLTTGELQCASIEPFEWEPTRKEIDDLLGIAAGLELNALHPIAKAVVSYARDQNAPIVKIGDFKVIPGQGIQGGIDSKNAVIGRPEFIIQMLSEERGSRLMQRVVEARQAGDLMAVLKIDENLLLFHFQDAIRPHMKDTLDGLKSGGKHRLVMLTGDHQASAQKIAGKLDIQEVYADLTPEEKLMHVTRLSRENGLAMVGDGINDSPALARATVGIAMGGLGSASAIEASGVVFLHDSIERLDWLMKKAHATRRLIKQNVSLAALAILIASIPALSGVLPLWLAVVMHEGGTVLVGLNGLRLLRK